MKEIGGFAENFSAVMQWRVFEKKTFLNRNPAMVPREGPNQDTHILVVQGYGRNYVNFRT